VPVLRFLLSSASRPEEAQVSLRAVWKEIDAAHRAPLGFKHHPTNLIDCDLFRIMSERIQSLRIFC